MQRSTNRILVTHVGSLPRPARLLERIQSPVSGQDAAFAPLLRDSIAEVVRKQAETGVDIVNDGEFSKPSFVTYVNDRLGGFEPDEVRSGSPWIGSREALAFPEYYAESARGGAGLGPGARAMRLKCSGPVTYKGRALLDRDIANLKAALHNLSVTEAFLP